MCVTELVFLNRVLSCSSGFQEHEKQLRIVRGLHGFQLYANEFWVETVLHCAEAWDGFTSRELSFLRLRLEELEDGMLDAVGTVSSKNEPQITLETLDPRSVYLSGHGPAERLVQAELAFKHRKNGQGGKRTWPLLSLENLLN